MAQHAHLASIEERLARALAVGQQGELRERELFNQMNRASCLMLLVSMVGAWNTVYLDRAVTALQEQGNPVPEEFLPHISPLRWPKNRVASPSGGSTFNTSAPRSDSMRVAKGPASTREKSRTRSPSNG